MVKVFFTILDALEVSENLSKVNFKVNYPFNKRNMNCEKLRA